MKRCLCVLCGTNLSLVWFSFRDCDPGVLQLNKVLWSAIPNNWIHGMTWLWRTSGSRLKYMFFQRDAEPTKAHQRTWTWRWRRLHANITPPLDPLLKVGLKKRPKHFIKRRQIKVERHRNMMIRFVQRYLPFMFRTKPFIWSLNTSTGPQLKEKVLSTESHREP